MNIKNQGYRRGVATFKYLVQGKVNMGRSPEKIPLFFWILSKKGREGPAQIFVTSSRGAFLVNKGAYFFQNANNLNFKLFF